MGTRPIVTLGLPGPLCPVGLTRCSFTFLYVGNALDRLARANGLLAPLSPQFCPVDTTCTPRVNRALSRG